MKRREFIGFLGAAAAWPVAARAQQPERMRRVAILMGTAETATDQTWIAAFFERLDELGWKGGRNLRSDLRWWTGPPEQMRGVIAEMLVSPPDVFVSFSNLALATLQPLVENVPVVFAGVGDPVGSGFVASLAHPGANITGFSSYDGPMGGKWLEVLKDTAPHLTHVVALLHPETPAHQAFWRAIEAAAPRYAIEVTPGEVHDATEIERVISSVGEKANCGLIILPHAVTAVNRDLIVGLTLRYRLPSITGEAGAANGGGLVYYGIDFKNSFRQAAEYVDRILRGEKAGDLPVQAPSKFELVIDLKTAKALGVSVPLSTLLLADKVIE